MKLKKKFVISVVSVCILLLAGILYVRFKVSAVPWQTACVLQSDNRHFLVAVQSDAQNTWQLGTFRINENIAVTDTDNHPWTEEIKPGQMIEFKQTENIVLESYPAQYPSVTHVRLIAYDAEEANDIYEKNLARYNDFVSQTEELRKE